MPASTHGLIIKYFHTQTTRTSSCTSMLNWSLWEKLTRAKCPTATVKPVAVETAEGSFSHRVRAITLFFLGCWLTGLPTVLLFFSEPFRASSLCFSAKESRHTWRERQMTHRPPQRHDDLRECRWDALSLFKQPSYQKKFWHCLSLSHNEQVMQVILSLVSQPEETADILGHIKRSSVCQSISGVAETSFQTPLKNVQKKNNS